MNGKRIALVTGVSSGIGLETARLLAENGVRVFGTVRRNRGESSGFETVPLDVTDESGVSEAVRSVLERAGRIDFLVNNAGYALRGGLEETSIEEARQLFDTNFFGVLRLIRAILPAMRKQGFGRIANISSVLGFLPAPYLGIYSASKHALEGYTETLDHEVRNFGIRAMLVEPAFTKTNINKNEKVVATSLDSYAEQKKRVADVSERGTADGDEPRAVAEIVWRALTDPSPRMRYPVGRGVTLSRLRRFVPPRIFDRTFRKQFRLDEPVRH
jgi:NAD(P)-dependent dehydrogenase (short-subunit alcohol dehydrogenase family)